MAKKNGLPVPAVFTTGEEAGLVALRGLNAESRLTLHGVGLEPAVICKLSSAQAAKRIERERFQLLGEFLPAVALCVDFLNVQRRVKTSSVDNEAYNLKHVVEYWASEIGRSQYIPTGALLAAAYGLGFKVNRLPPYQHHVLISTRTIRPFEVRP